MFLQSLPDPVRWAVLLIAGACLGSMLNLAIYRLAIYRKRNISPWSPAPEPERKRVWSDRLPVAGWWRLRREADIHGAGHWIRPMLIELGTAIWLAWFYHWQMNGGLFGGSSVRLAEQQVALVDSWQFGWFLFHSVLISLMIVATFIDFDEQTIPDWITVPGTLVAVLGHAFNSDLRLPVTSVELLTVNLDFLDFWSPNAAQAWHTGPPGVSLALAIVALWTFALVSKWTTLRWGFARGWNIMIASILRPARKTNCKVGRQRERAMLVSTKFYAALFALLAIVIVVVFQQENPVHWNALFDSLLGLAMGGGIVWSVRIIASHALGVEAMGFGDVTLMCMVGAFLGWQGALLAFIIAPFTSILVALVQLIITGDNQLAFGPYLCIGSCIVLIGWNQVWNHWAAHNVFGLGGTFLLITILVCLVLMAIMLGIWGKFKYRNEPDA